MRFFSINKKTLTAMIAASIFVAGNSQAGSSFNTQTTLSFNIDGISNAATPGDMSGLTILGSFTQAGSPTSYASFTGDGSVLANNPSIDSVPVTVGNPFANTFSVSGYVSNGSVTSSNAGWYALVLNNSSVIDDYSVKLTLAYNLLTNANGEFADSDVIVDVYSDSDPLLGNIFVNANTFGFPNAGANSFFPQYTFDIVHGSSLTLYANVTSNGNLQAAAVPLPAAAWLFLAGMMGILGFKKRRIRA